MNAEMKVAESRLIAERGFNKSDMLAFITQYDDIVETNLPCDYPIARSWEREGCSSEGPGALPGGGHSPRPMKAKEARAL
jgi:hypothetical protein